MEKSDVFRLFFLNYEKSYFSQILCKRWLVTVCSIFFFFMFSTIRSKYDLKNQRKKFVVFSWQNRHFYSDIDFEFRKMKKSDLFLLFFESIKSRVLPKFCVNVDKYYFFQFFWMFFSFLAKRRQNVIKKI